MKRSALIGAALAAMLAAVFAVGIGGASGAIGPPPPPPNYTLLNVSIGNGSATEGDYGAMQITARGSVPAATQSHIYWYTTNGTATAGLDYSSAASTLTFNAGETSKQFIVTISDDALVEGNETVILTLSNPTGGAVLGARSSATLTIVDND